MNSGGPSQNPRFDDRRQEISPYVVEEIATHRFERDRPGIFVWLSVAAWSLMVVGFSSLLLFVGLLCVLLIELSIGVHYTNIGKVIFGLSVVVCFAVSCLNAGVSIRKSQVVRAWFYLGLASTLFLSGVFSFG